MSESSAQKRALLAKLLQQKKKTYHYPLSYGQQALWFIYQNAPDNAAYNMLWSIELDGALDSTLLQSALQALVERHSVLRTRFETLDDGELVQRVHATGRYQWEQHNALDFSAAQLETAMRSAYEQPFDLTQGEVLRATLFQVEAQRFVLLLTMHHILGDASSMSLLGDELLALYEAERSGKKPVLASLSHHYADFVRAESETLATDNRSAEYWKQRLKDQTAVLDLPTDYPRPAIQTYQGASVPFCFSATLNKQLKQLAQQEKSTLFSLLLTAFHVLLYRYTGQDNLSIGTPTSTSRLNPEFANLIGYLVNPVVLQATLTEGLSFRQLLRKNSATVLEAVEHSTYPFSLLVKALQPDRELSTSPLFQVLFDYKPANSWVLKQHIKAVNVSPYEFSQMEGQFDLNLTLNEGELQPDDAPFKGRFNYNPALFSAETITRLTAQFEVLLSAIIADPVGEIQTLALLPSKEKQQLQAWNATQADYPSDTTLIALFEQQVAKTPDQIAVVFEDQSLTYQQLNQQANQLAHYLLSLKDASRTALLLSNNSLIALCVERSLNMVIALYAILKTGSAYVPIDPSYPADRIQYLLEDSDAPLLLTETELMTTLALDTSQAMSLCLDTLDISQSSQENPALQSQSSDLAYVIYTSGSTGKPKGTMNEHSGIVNRLLWMQARYQLQADDHILQKTPFSFDVSVWEFFWPLLTGARLVVAIPEGHKDPAYLAQAIEQHNITVLHFVPSMLQSFLSHANMSQCQGLKHIICSGEALTMTQHQLFFEQFNGQKTQLHNLYGPTEAAIDVSAWQCHPDDTSVPIGKPIANTQLHIVDKQHQIVPIGVAGELCIGGVQVCRGYLNRPKLTAEKFIDLPLFGETQHLYKTGDVAKWRADGAIEYIGRMDSQIKLRGFRIELGEVEANLLQCTEITACSVMVRKINNDNKQLVAYLVSNATDHQAVESDIKERLQHSLPDYMIPAFFVFMDALPLTPNGKIDRNALPEPVLRKRRAYIYPRNANEIGLAEIWGNLFSLPRISALDDFFELGGDSLLAIRLIAQVKKKFAISIPLHSIFQNKTLEQFALLLQNNANIDYKWSPLVCLQPEGEKTPLFFIHASGGSAFNYLEIATLMGTERPFYAIQPLGIEPGETPHPSIESMATDYVDAVRQVQPHGPYLFAGWSFGGTVIFEMTRLLEQAGETVAPFIMIDTPEPSATLTKEDDVEFMLDRVPHYPGVTLTELDMQTSSEARLTYLLKEIKMAGLFSPDIEQETALSWFNLYKHHNAIIGLHQPTGMIDAKIIFYAPTEKIPFDEQTGKPIQRWAPFTRDGLEDYKSPGNHFDMVSDANSPALVKMMKQHIDTFGI